MNMPNEPVKHHPHPQEEHEHEHEQHVECPEHFHRCYTKAVTFGYMDCPDEHHVHKPKNKVTKFLSVPCGADDPKPQIVAYLNNPANAHDLVTSISDLGHNGWLVTLTHEE